MTPSHSIHPEAGVTEARLFTRYLLDREPPSVLIERYLEADRRLLADGASTPDRGVVAFVLRHPRSLACLDAASGLLRPDSLLRRKLLVTAAVLETSTTFADEFLPRPVSRAGLVRVLLTAGILSVVELAVGIPLLWLAERPRR